MIIQVEVGDGLHKDYQEEDVFKGEREREREREKKRFVTSDVVKSK